MGTVGAGNRTWVHKAKRLGFLVIAGAIAGVTALRLTPFPESLRKPPAASPEFLDREGRSLRIMLVEERRFSQRCALRDVSKALIDATISAEDKRFWHHPGVDPLALIRAGYGLVSGKRPSSGGSTITQQLVKIAGPGPRTISRKLMEMWCALKVERTWDKERILEEYLNRLDYGNLQIGVAMASRYYFGKPPSDLSPAEAAFLAGLPKSPSRLNPHLGRASPSAASVERQHWVLSRMCATGRIDPAQYQRAIAEPLRMIPPRREFEAPHFVDLLLQRKGVLREQEGGFRTTLDLSLNHFVDTCIAEQLRRIADKHATSAAVVVIHNSSGEVWALAGSGDYFQPGTGQVNGAWMVRSPGSAVKPFTYLLALQNGANPCTVVPDVPTDFQTDTGLYRPNNYNHRFYGPVSLRFALGNSLNIAAIRTLQIAGGPAALQRCLLSLGITTIDHPAEWYGLGLTLGNAEVRLLELTNAFAALGRLGAYKPYRLLVRDEGDSASVQIFDRHAAYLVADMLSDNTARSASFGFNSYLSFDFPVGCKTGTSSDYRDNWAIGFTPEFTVGVWAGNVDGTPMKGITGVTGAAPIMHDVFVHLKERFGASWYAQPPGIFEERVNPWTGRGVAADRPGAVIAKCLWKSEPERPGDYDVNGRVILPAEYSGWLSSSQNGLGDLVTVSHESSDLRILTPLPGTVYFLDPDLPRNAQAIALAAECKGGITWSSTSLTLNEADGRSRMELREGVHRIRAKDNATGRTAETWIEVKPL